uniref:Uncharacterized protein n=1 Tax=Anguilla anguilla TaxID=7936 RepID=A0A0E9RL42_ANGAN
MYFLSFLCRFKLMFMFCKMFKNDGQFKLPLVFGSNLTDLQLS